MDNIKNNQYYIKKIIDDLSFLLAHTSGLSLDELESKPVLVDSVMFRLVQVSESSGKLTEEFKSQHSTINWKAMKGMRNLIVHDYGNVVLDVIYDTVMNDLPSLLEELKELVE